MIPLTQPQSRALWSIRTFIETHGFSPTLDEIKAALRCSKSEANRLVHILEQRGAITRAPRLRRSIQLVTPPRPPEGIDFLPHELAVWVRVIAAKAGVAPLDVVTEAVRDGYAAQTKTETKAPIPVSCETFGREAGHA